MVRQAPEMVSLSTVDHRVRSHVVQKASSYLVLKMAVRNVQGVLVSAEENGRPILESSACVES